MSINIGKVCEITQLSPKSVRLYEDKGLISKPNRSESGYREYSNEHIEQLKLIARAKSAGFSLTECKEFVSLASNPYRKSSEVKEKTRRKLDEVEKKIEQLKKIQEQLLQWLDACPGNTDSHCPIIDDLTKY
jgi:MerR family copper efflux transcriptional regulator